MKIPKDEIKLAKAIKNLLQKKRKQKFCAKAGATP